MRSTSGRAGGAGRYVAFLRGINVGHAKRVPMAELRAAIEELGFEDVRTLLNSGNAVFSGGRVDATSVALSLEEAVAARTGVRARVTVLSGAAFGRVVVENPLGAHTDDPARLQVAFLREPSAARRVLRELAGQSWGKEVLAVGRDAAYLWCPDGISRGQLATAVDRTLREGVTMRNWATVTKLQALL